MFDGFMGLGFGVSRILVRLSIGFIGLGKVEVSGIRGLMLGKG